MNLTKPKLEKIIDSIWGYDPSDKNNKIVKDLIDLSKLQTIEDFITIYDEDDEF